MDEFCAYARKLMADGGGGYDSFVEPGNAITRAGESEPSSGIPLQRMPQMPAYHLQRDDHSGITMVNIGVAHPMQRPSPTMLLCCVHMPG